MAKTITVELNAEQIEDILRWQGHAAQEYWGDQQHEADEATLQFILSIDRQLQERAEKEEAYPILQRSK